MTALPTHAELTKYAAAALQALAITLDHQDTGVVPDRPSAASIAKGQEIIRVILEGQ